MVTSQKLAAAESARVYSSSANPTITPPATNPSFPVQFTQNLSFVPDGSILPQTLSPAFPSQYASPNQAPNPAPTPSFAIPQYSSPPPNTPNTNHFYPPQPPPQQQQAVYPGSVPAPPPPAVFSAAPPQHSLSQPTLHPIPPQPVRFLVLSPLGARL
jgi:hypothetical protein